MPGVQSSMVTVERVLGGVRVSLDVGRETILLGTWQMSVAEAQEEAEKILRRMQK